MISNLLEIDNRFGGSRSLNSTSFMPMSENMSTGSSPTLSTPPAKRKRGRPPKATSLTNQITTRLNININTSPLTSSPTAESNSNLIVKQGAPDCFTPLMRVSPNSRRKKRKSSNSSLSDLSTPSKRSKNPNMLVTPMSSAVMGTGFTPHQINSRTLDNLSLITQSDSGIYQTPPSSTVKESGPTYLGYLNTPSTSNPSVKGSGRHNIIIDPSFLASEESPKSEVQKKLNANMQMGIYEKSCDRNLLPPVPIISSTLTSSKKQTGFENAPSTHISNEKPFQRKPLKDDSSKDFSLQLMVDESGKAVLSSKLNHTSSNSSTLEQTISSAKGISQTTEQRDVKLPEQQRPIMPHAHSVVGIEGRYYDAKRLEFNQDNLVDVAYMSPQQSTSLHSTSRRNKSETSGPVSQPNLMSGQETNESSHSEKSLQYPQTPVCKENYMYSSTGLTPGNSLAFNLTPQFNSLMYSMMNINSPQTKKPINNNQFLLNQEFFVNDNQLQNQQSPFEHHNTINMTDLMTIGESSGSFGKLQKPVDHHSDFAVVSSSSSSVNNEDSGDARSALKKIIHVKRK